jgi:alpha-ribazole phosphatase/probable phosphoglycerate mutase
VSTLIFETHATSLDNEAGLASGWFDVDLSPRGEEQAAALGERYQSVPLGRIYTSDLRRSFRTAELAFGSGATIVRDARLRECNYGDLTRQPGALVEAQRLDCIGTPFPNGESYAASTARVRAFLADVGAGDPAGVTLVIGHRATWYALEALLKHRPLRDVIGSPWAWQPGWPYPWPARVPLLPGGG